MLPAPDSHERLPQWFGGYVLLKELGMGGMGQVFLARLPGVEGIDRLCVIKRLRSRWSDDREYVARFIDEARVVVQLAHRNICPVFDVGLVLGKYYLAMDYVAGKDLLAVWTAVREAGRTVPVDIALHIAGEILEAADAAHRVVDPETDAPAHIVHRDISPQNVVISFDGEVKLIDFGLAQSTWKAELTEPGIVLGKLAYMSPEQSRGEAVDRRADVFAIGVLLYEMVTADRHWEGLSNEEVWHRVGEGGHRPARLDSVVPEVRVIIERALAAEPDDRYATGAAMRAAISQAQLARGVIAGASELRGFLQELLPGAAAAERRERAACLKLPNPPMHGHSEAVRIAKTGTTQPRFRPDSVAAPAAAGLQLAAPSQATESALIAIVPASSSPPAPPPAPSLSAGAASSPVVAPPAVARAVAPTAVAAVLAPVTPSVAVASRPRPQGAGVPIGPHPARSNPLVAVAVGVLVLAVAFAVALVWVGRGAAATARPGPAPVASSGAPEAAAVALPSPPAAPPPPSPPLTLAPPVPAPALVVPDVVAAPGPAIARPAARGPADEVKSAPPRPSPRPSPPASATTPPPPAEPAPSALVPPVVVAAPREQAPRPPARRAPPPLPERWPRLIDARVALLKSSCLQAAPCAAQVVASFPAFAAMDAATAQGYAADAVLCLDRCRASLAR